MSVKGISLLSISIACFGCTQPQTAEDSPPEQKEEEVRSETAVQEAVVSVSFITKDSEVWQRVSETWSSNPGCKKSVLLGASQGQGRFPYISISLWDNAEKANAAMKAVSGEKDIAVSALYRAAHPSTRSVRADDISDLVLVVPFEEREPEKLAKTRDFFTTQDGRIDGVLLDTEDANAEFPQVLVSRWKSEDAFKRVALTDGYRDLAQQQLLGGHPGFYAKVLHKGHQAPAE
ncbi:MAG: hypothetical protein AAFX94_23545 [Myxococcota bacterium]